MARIGGASPVGPELFMTVRAGMAYRHVFHAAEKFCENQLKAKFHCASWFEVGSKLVADLQRAEILAHHLAC